MSNQAPTVTEPRADQADHLPMDEYARSLATALDGTEQHVPRSLTQARRFLEDVDHDLIADDERISRGEESLPQALRARLERYRNMGLLTFVRSQDQEQLDQGIVDGEEHPESIRLGVWNGMSLEERQPELERAAARLRLSQQIRDRLGLDYGPNGTRLVPTEPAPAAPIPAQVPSPAAGPAQVPDVEGAAPVTGAPVDPRSALVDGLDEPTGEVREVPRVAAPASPGRGRDGDLDEPPLPRLSDEYKEQHGGVYGEARPTPIDDEPDQPDQPDQPDEPAAAPAVRRPNAARTGIREPLHREEGESRQQYTVRALRSLLQSVVQQEGIDVTPAEGLTEIPFWDLLAKARDIDLKESAKALRTRREHLDTVKIVTLARVISPVGGLATLVTGFGNSLRRLRPRGWFSRESEAEARLRHFAELFAVLSVPVSGSTPAAGESGRRAAGEPEVDLERVRAALEEVLRGRSAQSGSNGRKAQ